MSRVVIARKSLVSALQALARIAPKRSPKPILSHALLRIVADRRIELIATDLERRLTVTLDVDAVHRDDTTDNLPARVAWTLPIADTLQAAKAVPDSSVTLTPIGITHAAGSVDLTPYQLDDFPPFPIDASPFPCQAITYPATALIHALERVTPFCDKETTRYAFNSVLLQATPGSFVAVATDGRRLIADAYNADPFQPLDRSQSIQILLPSTACKPLPAMLKGQSSVTIQVMEFYDGSTPDNRNARRVRFTFGAYTFDVTTTDGNFPPYLEVFPKFDDAAPPVTLQAPSASALIPAIRAGASVLADDSRGIQIDAYTPEDVRPHRPATRIHAHHEGRSSAADLPGIVVAGRSGHVGVNPEFLIDALDAIGPIPAIIRWQAWRRPIRIDAGDGSCVVVIMPVNLGEDVARRDTRHARRAELLRARSKPQTITTPATSPAPVPAPAPSAAPVVAPVVDRPAPAQIQPTQAPAIDPKPIAKLPRRAPVATPERLAASPEALDAAALARYRPLVDALAHVPALIPLLEALQAHARAQSRPLGEFPELSANSPYRRSDPLASMLVELFYRLGWTNGQAKRKHLPPTGDVVALKRELMHALTSTRSVNNAQPVAQQPVAA